MEWWQSRGTGTGGARPGPAGARLAALVAALALVVTACGSGGGTGAAPAPAAPSEGGAPAAAFPVTVTDQFGQVEIPERPERVVALTMSDADVLVALGVTPVLFEAPSWIPGGINPWLSDALAGQPAPEGFEGVDGLPLEQIANAEPDLIIGLNVYGIADSQAQLAQIAPTVAWDETETQMPWRDQTRLIGDAVGKRAEADALVTATEAKIAEVRGANPGLAGKQALFAVGAYDGALYFDPAPERPYNELLTDIGLDVPGGFDPQIAELGLSLERLDQLADLDVLVFQPTDQAEYDAFVGLDLAKTLPVVQRDGIVELIDPVDAGSTTAGLRKPTVLSIPWVLDRLAPRLTEAATNTAS